MILLRSEEMSRIMRKKNPETLRVSLSRLVMMFSKETGKSILIPKDIQRMGLLIITSKSGGNISDASQAEDVFVCQMVVVFSMQTGKMPVCSAFQN